MFKKWPFSSLLAIIAACAILAAEYVFFTFSAIDVGRSWLEPSSSVVYDYPAEGYRDTLKWSEDAAVSPDGSKQARAGSVIDENGFNIARVIIEDTHTKRELAHVDLSMMCLLHQGACHIDEVAWVDDSIVAFRYTVTSVGENNETVSFWEWKTSRTNYSIASSIVAILIIAAVLFGPSIALIIWALHNIRRANELANS